MKAIARTVFKKSPSAAAAAAPVAPSVLNEAELTQILRTDVNDASTTLDADTAIDVEHDDDYDAFADIDEVDGTVPVDDDDDNRVLPFEAASFVTLEDEAEEEDFEEVDADDNDATTDAADAAGAAATNDANDVNDVNGVNDVNVTNVAEVPVVKKIRKRTVHPAAQIMRDFEEQVKGKRATFILVLGALQKLSIHDRPRSMMRVIRLAEHLGSVTPRQRMRMRYTLIAHNIMHHRYEKAYAMLQAAGDLTVIEASLSAVIVALETRKTAEADKFAVQVDGLMRAANCRFSQDSLNSLLLIHSNHNDAAGAHDAYARLRDHGLEVEADSLAAYMRLLAFTVPETALAVGYRSRRDGITINGQMYTSMIRACLDLNQLQRAVALFDMGIRQGVRHTSVTFGWLLDAFCQLRDDARVDEFLAWSKAQNAPMNAGIHDVIIRRAFHRNDVDAAQQQIEAALDAGFIVDHARFVELVMRLLAIDQRRRAQQFLRAVAPKISEPKVLIQAVKAVASAFGREWNDAVDWLHEMRDLGVHVPAPLFAIAATPLKNDVESTRAYVGLMREQQVPLVRDHYSVALRNCVNDCDATVALFRQMLEVDGIVPDSASLAALVTAYVSCGRRSDALRAILSTVGLMTNVQFDDRIYEPFLNAAPVLNEAERTEFKLDASGKPSLERVLQLTGQRLPLHATFSFQVRLGQLAAEQRHFNFVRSQVPSVEQMFPHDALEYHDTVMRVLLTPSAYDTGDTVRRAAEVAMQLFERAHKLALLRSPEESGLVTVRRVTAFRDNCFDEVPPALDPVHVGTLGNAVHAILERPVAQRTNINARSIRMWNNAMRACHVAGLKVQRAALEADWKLVSESLTLTTSK